MPGLPVERPVLPPAALLDLPLRLALLNGKNGPAPSLLTRPLDAWGPGLAGGLAAYAVPVAPCPITGRPGVHRGGLTAQKRGNRRKKKAVSERAVMRLR